MTGFGLGHYEDKSISIDVEIRSFNSRYFELQTRYFDLSSETEYKIRKFLKDNLKRGSITLSIKIDSKNQFKINNHKISSLLQAYKEIEKKYDIQLDYNNLLSNNDLIRFSTSNPQDMSIDVIKVMAKYHNICKHIHLPVQSGSNKILKAMNRQHTREEYIDSVSYTHLTLPAIYSV